MRYTLIAVIVFVSQICFGQFSRSKLFIGDEYEKYQKLSDRGKYIVDSLDDKNIPMYQDNYLLYEPIYMKRGKEVYKSYKILDQEVVIYYYSIWNNSKGNGVQLIKEVSIK